MVGDVFDVCTTQLRSPLGLCCLPLSGTQSRPRDHMTFVQVHTASLAWARFNAGCESPAPLRPECVDRTNTKT
jgi:hypothetical protein